ncbi:uncharacterized protein [Euphorbia lathyris]|uniref:uncharacterized protein isoform X2 n=1 Tax=Euphorbia lathyris TaxID=212925 RepID=UPI00331341E4
MGGDADRFSPFTLTPTETVTDDESSVAQEPSSPISLPFLPSDELCGKLKHDTVNRTGFAFEGFEEMGPRISSASLELEANRRKRYNAYKDVLHTYDHLQIRTDNLNQAKTNILSYMPGGWIEKAGGMKLQDYNVPETTTLLLVGPKGSGKSSLVNRISRVFEEDKFAPDRAQVSYNSSVGDGTYFLQEYMIPRGSTAFCLYDTRSLSGDTSDNVEMLKDWITKGVHHGELVIRQSDDSSLRIRMKNKARSNGTRSKEKRMVNFVIYVVSGLEFLKSMDNEVGEGTAYAQMIATTFNFSYLSFRDYKPVVAVTHGDLLSLPDRARIRVHLGELLGIPPAKQIFDIPESSDPVTELAIVDMLRYALEHADKNLPPKDWIAKKIQTTWEIAETFMKK